MYYAPSFRPVGSSPPPALAVADLSFLTSGIPIWPFQVEFALLTDVSTQGSGSIWGTWTRGDRSLLINCLELEAVILALHHWATVLQAHQVMIASDNTTVVSYINKHGGMNSLSLYVHQVVDRFLWLQSQDIVLRARRIPGSLNIIADRLSRPKQLLSTEWSFYLKIITRIFKTWGSVTVDMFATVPNTRLPSSGLQFRSLKHC